MSVVQRYNRPPPPPPPPPSALALGASGTPGGGGDASASTPAPTSPQAAAGGARCSVEETFKAFCSDGAEMDSKSFVKLCKRCCLLDNKFTAHDARLVFTTTVPVNHVRMDLRSFEEALAGVAAKRGLDQGLVRRMVAWYEPPEAARAAVPTSTEKHAQTWSHGSKGDTVVRPAVKRPETACLGGRPRNLNRAESLPCVGRIRPRNVTEDFESASPKSREPLPPPIEAKRLKELKAPKEPRSQAAKEAPCSPRLRGSRSEATLPAAPIAPTPAAALAEGLSPASQLPCSLSACAEVHPRNLGYASGPQGLPHMSLQLPLQTMLPGHPGSISFVGAW